jgi:uncharacterized repeat protein (TIGR04076 family)
MAGATDEFELYDLHVEVICPPGERIYCGAKPGDHFLLQGEMLHLPEGQGFSIYSLGGTLQCNTRPMANAMGVAAVLPLLAAKQRPTHKNDWITTDSLIACPDPGCKSQLKITRLQPRQFSHAETTAVPLG